MKETEKRAQRRNTANRIEGTEKRGEKKKGRRRNRAEGSERSGGMIITGFDVRKTSEEKNVKTEYGNCQEGDM